MNKGIKSDYTKLNLTDSRYAKWKFEKVNAVALIGKVENVELYAVACYTIKGLRNWFNSMNHSGLLDWKIAIVRLEWKWI